MTDLNAAPSKLKHSSNADVISELQRITCFISEQASEKQWETQSDAQGSDKMPNLSSSIATDSFVVKDCGDRGTNPVRNLPEHCH